MWINHRWTVAVPSWQSSPLPGGLNTRQARMVIRAAQIGGGIPGLAVPGILCGSTKPRSKPTFSGNPPLTLTSYPSKSKGHGSKVDGCNSVRTNVQNVYLSLSR